MSTLESKANGYAGPQRAFPIGCPDGESMGIVVQHIWRSSCWKRLLREFSIAVHLLLFSFGKKNLC